MGTTEVEEMQATIKRLHEKIDELEAQCAAMRGALEKIQSISGDPPPENWWYRHQMTPAGVAVYNTAAKALSADAGKDLLERLQYYEEVARQRESLSEAQEKRLEKLEAVVEAATELRHAIPEAIGQQESDDGCWQICVECDLKEELAKFRQALDALEKP